MLTSNSVAEYVYSQPGFPRQNFQRFRALAPIRRTQVWQFDGCFKQALFLHRNIRFNPEKDWLEQLRSSSLSVQQIVECLDKSDNRVLLKKYPILPKIIRVVTSLLSSIIVRAIAKSKFARNQGFDFSTNPSWSTVLRTCQLAYLANRLQLLELRMDVEK